MKTLQNATKPYLGSKISRVSGRVTENPLVSVTIDVLMMRIPGCRASGSDRENGVDGKVDAHKPSSPIKSKGRTLIGLMDELLRTL